MNNKYYNFVSFKSFVGIWSLLVALEIPKYCINFFTTSTTVFFSLNFLFISFLTQARSFLILQVIFPKETFRTSNICFEIYTVVKCQLIPTFVRYLAVRRLTSSKQTKMCKPIFHIISLTWKSFSSILKQFPQRASNPAKTSEYSVNFFSIIYLLKLLQPLYRVPWMSYGIVSFSSLLHFCCSDIALKIELSCKFPPEFCNLKLIR